MKSSLHVILLMNPATAIMCLAIVAKPRYEAEAKQLESTHRAVELRDESSVPVPSSAADLNFINFLDRR